MVAALVVSIALLSAACGRQTANATQIGIRPAADAAQLTARADLRTMAAVLANELASVNSTTPIPGEDWVALGELPLDSTLTLNQVERLLRLQQLCELMIQERQAAIASMVGLVASNSFITGYQKANIYSLLNAGSAQLRALQVKVAREQLVDEARADAVRIASLRIYGVLAPKVRLLIAAYQLQRLAQLYSSLQSNLQAAVSAQPSSGSPISPAQPYLNDLGNQITVMSNNSYYMLSLVYGIVPSAYPGNKPQLRAARQAMVRGQVAGDAGAADIAKVKAYLGLP